jgi:hypothetical protein
MTALASYGRWLVVLALLAMPSLLFAQAGAPPAAVAAPVTVGGVTLIGPSPPIAPDTAARDTDGHATLRATRIDETLRIDGHLDENVYRTVQPIGGFIQTEPQPGEPATEATDVWIFFDDRAIYVAARCWDSAPESRWVANEMRRDNTNVVRNENVAVLFDTYYDHRNGFVFELSPVGGVYDASVTNERSPGNPEWNPIWERKAGRFEHGWIAEMAIPFKSLRYKPGTPQVWGFNMRRTVRWKNEESFITRMVPNPGSPLFQVSQEGVLVGVEVPSASLNLEMKPYGISSMTTDRRSTPAVLNDGNADAGFDVKYGVSQNLTADFTYNTDFAQVEVDEQQVNLTRFTLFFPEKREFFLEGQGIYDFGGASSSASGGGGQGLTPLLFFSRRIGLNQIGTLNRVVPINAGGRLTGKVGRTTIGLLNVYAGDDPAAGGARATDFSVVRDCCSRADRSRQLDPEAANRTAWTRRLACKRTSPSMPTSPRPGRGTSPTMTSVIAAISTTTPIVTASSSSGSSSAPISIPMSGFCGAPGSTTIPRCCGSVLGRGAAITRPSGALRIRPTSTTSRTAPGGWKRAPQTRCSALNFRTAIG